MSIIDADTAAYPYDAKTTVEYSLTYTGFKEDIVVSEYTGQTTYPFRLLTNGLALEEIDGSFFLVDDEGNIEASIGDIIIFTADERNNAFGDIEPKTIIENQEYLLNIVVDAEYLADPATTYPIRIDPTIEIKYSNNGAGAVEDITISTNTNFSGSYTSLYVGRRSTEGIARILMRFPALDVSNLAGATVTSATVRVRDLMCEDDPLDVSCHVFTGSVWDGSSATWANSSPNSYVATPLSTRTLAWSIGDTFSSKHWYTFDVTEAVQGWINKNYTQSKGIIFKVASSIENGTAIKNRTFGSYNRTNYRPSLTVTYTPNTSQTLTNDTYYLNNRGTGKYLQLNTTNNAQGVSGLLSSLGNRIQWKIQPVGSGYVIRAASNPNLCLSCGASPGDSSVYALTVSDSSIPSTCMWSITPASGGDYLIRSMAYGNYLYSSVTSIYTSSSTGSYGSSRYEQYVWRAAKTSAYGNTSSYTYRELESGFSVNNIILNTGDGYTPFINNKSSGALWADLRDFSFTLSSGTSGCISVAELNNRLIAQKPGIATYTVTHKVTDRTTQFEVYVKNSTLDASDVALLKNSFYRHGITGYIHGMVYNSHTAEEAIDVIVANDSIITNYCNEYRIPKEFVQSVLFRELWCYSTTDEAKDLAVEAYYAFKTGVTDELSVDAVDDSSTGLAQIFARTAIKALNNADNRGFISLDSGYNANDWQDIWSVWSQLHNSTDFNLKCCALVILDCQYEFEDELPYEGFFNFSETQIKRVLARYNGTGSAATDYGNICYEYYNIFKIYNQ